MENKNKKKQSFLASFDLIQDTGAQKGYTLKVKPFVPASVVHSIILAYHYTNLILS